MPSRSNLSSRELNRGPAGESRDDSETEVVRRVAGPASDAVRRAALNKRLAEREPVADTPAEPEVENPTRDLSVVTAAKRLKNNWNRIDKAVEDAK